MTAIEFENISKQYRLGLVSTRTLSHDLKRWYTMNIQGKEDPYLKIGEVNDRSHKGESEYVWALKDINFKVEQGDVLGIIGKNGAGKSTLLKILSKVTTPTTGTIKARGRIASLLEVGTGFHPEMTGRENIYMNGAIMGMTKAEITRKLDEIVDFSGVERYLDTPVKRYSSGMTVRLGFAIAAHLDPEILVVDEVLAVGDAEFQKKAIGKMQDVSRGEGRTVLFVSHNMGAVRNLCKTGIVLKNGGVDFNGSIDETISHYLSQNENQSNIIDETNIELFRQGENNLNVEMLSIALENKELQSLSTKDDITFRIKLKGNKESEYNLYATIYNEEEIPIGCIFDKNKYYIKKGETQFILFKVLNHKLAYGNYKISFATGVGDFTRGILAYDVIHLGLSFSIEEYEKGLIGFSNWSKGWGEVIFDSITQKI